MEIIDQIREGSITPGTLIAAGVFLGVAVFLFVKMGTFVLKWGFILGVLGALAYFGWGFITSF